MKNSSLIVETARKMVELSLVKGTWGNISLRDGDKIWITPSGVDYFKLKDNDIAVIELSSGKQISGNKKASSELPLHLEIYRNFANLNGIVHTHSTYATVYACMHKDIPCYVEDQAQIIGGEIRVARYAFPGSEELAQNVVEALKDGHFGVLMSNHGSVGVGRNLKEAMITAQIIEKSAEVSFLVQSIGNFPGLSQEDIEKMRKIYLNKYSEKILEK
jgi:L-ribulose-5-phosphate 4-epimerase